MEESSRSSPDSPDSSHHVHLISPDISGEISTDSEKEEVRTITASNRSSVDSVLPNQAAGIESLNRRKSRSISNFQRDNLDQ